jgi:hypothetical protein
VGEHSRTEVATGFVEFVEEFVDAHAGRAATD